MLIKDLLHVLNPYQILTLYLSDEAPEIQGLTKENFEKECPQYLNSPIIEMWSETDYYDNSVIVLTVKHLNF